MPINTLQKLTANPALPAVAAGKSNVSPSVARGFEAILGALHTDKDGVPAKSQQAAAELMRVEMMHNTLSLFSEGEGTARSASGAVDALVSTVLGKERERLTRTEAGKTADEMALLRELSDPENIMPSREMLVNEIGKTAAQYVGTPYRFGGEGRDGIDCSSFVQQVFREQRIELPRTAREQIKMGTEVAQGDLKKGDLIFFHTYASFPSHVGIYLGDGKMIHASSAKGEVTVSDINTNYYRSHFIGAKRIG
jgi:hypothetical protein